MATSIEAAVESLRQIKSTEPPVWLVPKQELSQAVRAASKHLFSSLKPHSPKSPFDQLLIDGFDAEQIWQQIDLQSQPLLSNLRREVKKFEKNPEEISKLKEAVEGGRKKVVGEKETDDVVELDEDEDDDDMDMEEEEEEDDDDDDDDDDNDDGEEEEEEEEKEKKRGREEEEESEDEGRESEGEEKGGIEDKFLKIKELQKYLEDDEAREFGMKKKKRTEIEEDMEEEEGEDEEEEEEENDEDDEAGDEEDELGLFDEDDEDDEDNLENARF